MMKKIANKIFSVVLCLAMILSLSEPMAVYADTKDVGTIAENLMKKKATDISYTEGMRVNSEAELYAAISKNVNANTKKIVIRYDSKFDYFGQLAFELVDGLLDNASFVKKYGEAYGLSSSDGTVYTPTHDPTGESEFSATWETSDSSKSIIDVVKKLDGTKPIELTYSEGMNISSDEEAYAVIKKRIKKDGFCVSVPKEDAKYYLDLFGALAEKLNNDMSYSYKMTYLDDKTAKLEVKFNTGVSGSDFGPSGRTEDGKVNYYNLDKKKSKKELMDIMAETKLFRKSETLYIGEKDKIKVMNLHSGWSVKYSSSNKDVASVDSDGVVTAKKAGETTINVVVSSKGTESKTFTTKIKVEKNNVTKIDSYSALKSALTNGKGGHLQITKKITGASTIEIKSGNYVIDLNGNTIEGDTNQYSIIYVNGADVTVRDSSVNEKNKAIDKGIIANLGGVDAIGMDKGSLTIDGGQFVGILMAMQMGGGKLTVNDGRFNSSGAGYESVYSVGTFLMFGGTAVINGGSFSTDDEIDLSNAINVQGDGGKLTINGGAFEAIYSPLYVSRKASKTDIEINYGYFKASSAGSAMTIEAGNAVINYASVINTVDSGIRITGSNDKTTVTINDIYCETKDTCINIQHDTNLYINNGTFIHPIREEDGFYEEDSVQETGEMEELIVYDSFVGSLYYNPECIKNVTDMSAIGNGVELVDEFKLVKINYKPGMEIKNVNQLYSLYMYAAENALKEFSYTADEKLYNTAFFYENDWSRLWNSNCHSFINISSGYIEEHNSDRLYVTVSELEYSLTHKVDLILRHPKMKKKFGKAPKKYAKFIKKVCKTQTNAKMTDSEKVEAIHDYMCKNFRYDYDFESDSYWVNGIIDNKKGVCQAYSFFFQLCMNYLGIDCECYLGYMCSGPSKNDFQGHMWNRVRLDGSKEWLYLDVTNNDSFGFKKFYLKNEKDFFGMGYHM